LGALYSGNARSGDTIKNSKKYMFTFLKYPEDKLSLLWQIYNERLKHEHRDFESRLMEIEEGSRTNSEQAIEMLGDLGKSILRHAVEEDARIMRVIRQKAKKQSEQSIKVMQDHRQIIEFLDKTISQLKTSSQEESARIR
jgi:hypothetical protein